jgi:hypothetical protein
VGEAEAAVGAEEDDAAVAAEAVVEVGDGFAGGDFWGGAGGYAVGGPLAEDQLHDGFAPAGEGDGGGEVVGVAAATDEGGVADAAGGFVEGASGGGGGGEVAVAVEGYGAYGVVAVKIWRVGSSNPTNSGRDLRWTFGAPERRLVGRIGAPRSPRARDRGHPFAVAFEGGSGSLSSASWPEKVSSAKPADWRAWASRRRSRSRGRTSSALSMRACRGRRRSAPRRGRRSRRAGTFFEDEAGGLDGVAEALDAGDAAGFHAAAVHEEGVELDAAVGGEEAAAAGVEGGVVFKDGDGGFNGVDGGAAEGEDAVAGFEGVADAGLVGGCGVGGDGPGAAVDEEDGVVSGFFYMRSGREMRDE